VGCNIRILITGSRTWTDVSTIISAITEVVREHHVKQEDAVIVHGDCPRGADAIAGALARLWKITEEPHPADWSKGKPAGFIRNKEMVDLGADVCLAFIQDNSKGASMAANLAQKAGIPTKIYRS
jgi:hypothetical protein